MLNPAIGKKWFLLTEKARYSSRLDCLPDREVRIYEPEDHGYKLTVVGAAGGEAYDWTFTVRQDNVKVPVICYRQFDHVIVNTVETPWGGAAEIGTYYKGDLLVGNFYHQVHRDKDDREYLRVIETLSDDGAPPLYNVLMFMGSRI